MQIRISEFCGLSRAKLWQDWLQNIATDLYTNLIKILSDPKGGCKKNTQAMVDIYSELLKRKLGDKLNEFLKKEFPNVIDNSPKSVFFKPKKSNIDAEKYKSIKEANKHKVFKNYNPSLLTFPQKLIIIDPDISELQKKINTFIMDKVSTEYVIIEDRAYIEYFLQKYKSEALKYPKELSEINKWRKENLE